MARSKKKTRGRPKGSKNKKSMKNPWDLSLYSSSALSTVSGKRGRGRPKGSKGSAAKSGLVRAKQIFVKV